MIDIRGLRAMPALSIRQPWVELIFCGRKYVEVRTWKDPYRGPLWLHTGAKLDKVAARQFRMHSLFTGGLVGIAQLASIRPFTPETYDSWRDRHLDFSPFPSGRDLYAWILSDVKRLDPPSKYSGALRLFQVNTSAISDKRIMKMACFTWPENFLR
jgi:hypothetical protein